jgi:predicted nuclease with TOPRIM domain
MNELDMLKQQIEELKGKLTGNMMEDMEIRDKIHNLEMKVNGVKPTDSHFDCIGCGS